MKFGILIGRFQPLHAGHQSTINEIMHDGLTPVVLIGSSGAVDEKNPFSYAERALLINEIYGGHVITLPLPDKPTDSGWASCVKETLVNAGIHHCVIYYHHKKGDYDIFPLLSGFNFVKPSYYEPYINLSATKIRQSPDSYKQYLDGRVLQRLNREHKESLKII